MDSDKTNRSTSAPPRTISLHDPTQRGLDLRRFQREAEGGTGLDDEDVAHAVGMTIEDYRRLKAGGGNPHRNTLEKFARFYKATLVE